jgi:hypothetical protein
MKTLDEKRIEFETYKLKKKKKITSSVRNMHHSINLEEIKTENEKLGHTVTNIWNIKQYTTKLPLSMVFVEPPTHPCGGNHPATYKGCTICKSCRRKHTHLSV